MRTIEPNPFSSSLDDRVGDGLRLAVGRELAKFYTDVLHQPMPRELRVLVDSLEDRYRSRGFPGSQQP